MPTMKSPVPRRSMASWRCRSRSVPGGGGGLPPSSPPGGAPLPPHAMTTASVAAKALIPSGYLPRRPAVPKYGVVHREQGHDHERDDAPVHDHPEREVAHARDGERERIEIAAPECAEPGRHCFGVVHVVDRDL